jgi:hypothetical protein
MSILRSTPEASREDVHVSEIRPTARAPCGQKTRGCGWLAGGCSIAARGTVCWRRGNTCFDHALLGEPDRGPWKKNKTLHPFFVCVRARKTQVRAQDARRRVTDFHLELSCLRCRGPQGTGLGSIGMQWVRTTGERGAREVRASPSRAKSRMRDGTWPPGGRPSSSLPDLLLLPAKLVPEPVRAQPSPAISRPAPRRSGARSTDRRPLVPPRAKPPGRCSEH